jgi:hypothetical protein
MVHAHKQVTLCRSYLFEASKIHLPSIQDCAGASHDGFHEVHKANGLRYTAATRNHHFDPSSTQSNFVPVPPMLFFLRLPESILPSIQDCAGASHDGFHEVHTSNGLRYTAATRTTTSIHLPHNPNLCRCLPCVFVFEASKSIFPSIEDCAGASHDGFHEVHKANGLRYTAATRTTTSIHLTLNPSLCRCLPCFCF